jgi:mycothiol synthase
MAMEIVVAAPYQLRRADPADAEAICEVMAALDLAVTGDTERYAPEDVISDLKGIDGETTAWVVTGPDGEVVGYATATNHGSGQLNADGYVHPAHWGHGLGTALVRLTEARAREFIPAAPEGAQVTLGCGIHMSDEAARGILEREGFALVRVHWTMRIDQEEAPPAPEWPAGITLRTFVRGRDERATFDCVEEAFSDHWGHTPGEFAQWVKRVERPDFDPSLWLLAEADGELAGVSLCRVRPGTGWVGSLAVRRPWRQRGLGLALLRQSFGEFWRRGERRVALGVDSQNLTGATRLYERAGMHITMRIGAFDKVLRPGVDLRTQALAE